MREMRRGEMGVSMQQSGDAAWKVLAMQNAESPAKAKSDPVVSPSTCNYVSSKDGRV